MRMIYSISKTKPGYMSVVGMTSTNREILESIRLSRNWVKEGSGRFIKLKTS